jgi:hypothetical protein
LGPKVGKHPGPNLRCKGQKPLEGVPVLAAQRLTTFWSTVQFERLLSVNAFAAAAPKPLPQLGKTETARMTKVFTTCLADTPFEQCSGAAGAKSSRSSVDAAAGADRHRQPFASEKISSANQKRTPQTTVEAVMYAVKSRGVGALMETENIERLLRCDDAAKKEINSRIARLIAKQEIAA